MSYYQPTTPPSLEHAHYGVGPVEAVKRVYQKYAVFDGRASRGEYWWFVLFTVVVYLVVGGLGAVIAEVSEANGGTAGGGAMVMLILLGIFVLGSILPSIAVTVRRLHDAGYSGTLYLINLIPYLGSLILCTFLVLKASPAGDKYDPGAPLGYGIAPGQYGYATPYAQSGYPQSDPYGQPIYGQPIYGQTDAYGQPGYGQADPYAQPGYGQTDPYTQPGFGQDNTYWQNPHNPQNPHDPDKP